MQGDGGKRGDCSRRLACNLIHSRPRHEGNGPEPNAGRRGRKGAGTIAEGKRRNPSARHVTIRTYDSKSDGSCDRCLPDTGRLLTLKRGGHLFLSQPYHHLRRALRLCIDWVGPSRRSGPMKRKPENSHYRTFTHGGGFYASRPHIRLRVAI